MSEMNRREFVAAVAVAAACACLGCPDASALAAPSSAGPVDVGTLADYSKDAISAKFIRSNRIAVVRNEGKIYATSAICTHRQAMLTVHGDEFVCPKHGSHFSIHGTVTHKPATDSLERFAISKNPAGHLIVDTSKSFSEKDWDNPDAFVSVT